MSKIILMLLVCIAFSAFGQKTTEWADISTTKTENHVNIPGTRLYMIPPAGFKIATSFLGLQREDGASFNVFDIVGGNYYQNAATFNRETFEQKGATVFEYGEFMINGFPAKYVVMQSNPNAKAIGVVFGDTTFSTLIMATYPAINADTRGEILDALHAVYYDVNFKLDPFATASFTLDESKSKFKFSSSNSGLFIYTEEGKKEDINAAFITIITMPRGMMNGQIVSGALIAGMEKRGFTDKKLKNDKTETINEQLAYSVEVYGKMQDENMLIYQFIVLGQDKVVAFQGIAKVDFSKNLKEFEKLAKTIKLK